MPHRRSVRAAQALTCFVGAMVGDLLAQLVTPPLGGGLAFDAARNLQLASFGLLIGGTSAHYWHTWLERRIWPAAPRAPRAVLTKLALDQVTAQARQQMAQPAPASSGDLVVRLLSRTCGSSGLACAEEHHA